MPTSPLESSTTPDQAAAVPFDAHGIEAIPDDGRDCSPWELFWIWSGANIAPINWVLGALGITLGLSLVETLVVVVLGNVVGCAVFGVFNVIGHRTAVNQMVLGRAPFGLKGAIVPGVVQFFLTMGWVGVNTWVVLDLVLAVLGGVRYHRRHVAGVRGGGRHHGRTARACAVRLLRDPQLREIHRARNSFGDGADDDAGAGHHRGELGGGRRARTRARSSPRSPNC